MLLEARGSSNEVDCSLLETLAEVSLETITLEMRPDRKGEHLTIDYYHGVREPDGKFYRIENQTIKMPTSLSPVKIGTADALPSTGVMLPNSHVDVLSSSSHNFQKGSHLRTILPKVLPPPFLFGSKTFPSASFPIRVYPINKFCPDFHVETTRHIHLKRKSHSKFTNLHDNISDRYPCESPGPKYQVESPSPPSTKGPLVPYTSSSLVHRNTGLKRGRLDVIAYEMDEITMPKSEGLICKPQTASSIRSIIKRKGSPLKDLFDRLRDSLHLPISQKYKKFDLLSKAIDKLERLKEKKKNFVKNIKSFSKNLFKGSSHEKEPPSDKDTSNIHQSPKKKETKSKNKASHVKETTDPQSSTNSTEEEKVQFDPLVDYVAMI